MKSDYEPNSPLDGTPFEHLGGYVSTCCGASLTCEHALTDWGEHGGHTVMRDEWWLLCSECGSTLDTDNEVVSEDEYED
jgi:hypothetical protein